MDTRHIEYLETVAEHGSISAAARALDLNQPSLTKILHRLEHEFGVQLFERNARGVKMTPFGERFLARSRLISREMRDLATELEDLKAGRSGHVTVGTGQIWLSSILPPAIAACARQFPDLTTSIRTGARRMLLEQLHRGELDVFLGAVADDVGVEVHTKPVASVRFDIAAREGHPLTSRRGPVRHRDLLDFGWILPPATDPTVAHVHDVFYARGLQPPRAVVEAVSVNFVSHTLRESDLLGMLPDARLTGMTGLDGLVSLNVEGMSATRAVGIHTMRGRCLVPGAQIFIDTVTRVARER